VLRSILVRDPDELGRDRAVIASATAEMQHVLASRYVQLIE
jgi:hypothetical protein